MELGAFSVSLAVRDIEASRSFYEKFGFKVFGGDATQNWLILKNGDHVIGLFQGMFEKNILSFNPPDVRNLQKLLKNGGVRIFEEVDEKGSGPASIMFEDPDGNQIMLDQP